MAEEKKSVMMIVGDVSADRHASLIVKELEEHHKEIEFWGIGGTKMKEAGVELIHHLQDFISVGIVEIIRFLPFYFKVQQELIDNIKSRKPDMLLLVDFGTFNLIMARRIRKIFPELPILYFISPQIWASRPWRINSVKNNISKMLVIFPFEEAIYREKGIQARFVGHPLLEQIPRDKELSERKQFLENLGIESKGAVISIFPGSRRQEIKQHAPVLLQAIEELLQKRPDTSFIISLIDEKTQSVMNKFLEKQDKANLVGKNLFFIEPEANYAAMKNADLVWAKSGTTTLEVAMFAKPMLIFYRGNWLSYFLVLVFKTIKNVGLPNLLAGKKLVPELLQLDCSAKQFVRYTSDLLDVPGLRKEITEELSQIRDQLGKGKYITNCTEEILKYLHIKPSIEA